MMDGWSLHSRVTLEPGRWATMALERMRFSRRADSGYRPRFLAAPEDPAVVLGAFENFTEQLRVRPGSWLWGLQFVALTGSASDILVQVQLDMAGETLFSAPAPAAALTRQSPSQLPYLLATPVRLDDLVSVQLYNTVEADRSCQLLLLVAEGRA